MTINVVIGKRSTISHALKKKIPNIIVLSSNSKKDMLKLASLKKKVNIIFNNFYPSSKINTISSKDYNNFNQLTLKSIIEIISLIKTSNINKIIYTSSSSVYILPNNINFLEKDKFNRILQGSFKIAAEALISNFALKNNIKIYIMRVFNTYGDSNCNFSFIENLIKKKKSKEKVKLINGGRSVRDFIHVDDVAKIYKIFLKKNVSSGIYDVGTGDGYSIKNLIEFVKIKKNQITKINNIDERDTSVCNLEKLINVAPGFKFVSIEKYLKKKCNITTNISLKKSINIDENLKKISGNIIYGAGFAGKALQEELSRKGENVLFFIDDKNDLYNTTLNKIKIINLESLLKIKDRLDIKKIFIAIPSLSNASIEKKIKKLKKYFFDVRFLPEKKFLISDKIDLNDIKIDEINNIIKRKKFSIKAINSLRKKSVLVTGGGGSIGSEIIRQLVLQKAKNIVAYDNSELNIYTLKNKLGNQVKYCLGDINDISRLENVLKKYKIDLVIHAAAYKHLNILEKDLVPAVKNNIFGTLNVCNSSIKNNSNFILISTDKAANPTSVLGYTKRFAEMICEYLTKLSKSKNFINIVRFGNVFGSSGSAITNFIDQINDAKDITITNRKATRYFMTINEACYLVLNTVERKFKNKTFVLNMGKPINIFNLATQIGNLKKRINPFYNYKIIETGLKPGEKLHEKLLSQNEKIIYKDNLISVIENKKINLKNFEKKCIMLQKYYDQNDNKKMLKIIK